MPERELIRVYLNDSSPRFEAWARIFDGEKIPLKSPMPSRAQLGPEKDVEVYSLDIPKLSVGQRERLVQWAAEHFGVAPVLIEEQLDSIGFPIREVDLIVAMDYRLFA